MVQLIYWYESLLYQWTREITMKDLNLETPNSGGTEGDMKLGQVLYFGGDIIIGNRSFEYSIPHVRAIRISRSITLSELVQVVQRKLNIDPMKFTIKLSSKYSFMDKSSWNEVQFKIEDDDALEFMMGCHNMQMLQFYVEIEPLHRDAGFVEPESYIPHVTEELNTINDQHGTSIYWGIKEHYDYSYFEHGSGSLDQYITIYYIFPISY